MHPYELLGAELYFPTQKDILQSNTFSALISAKASSEFRVEFRDNRKVTAKYVSGIKGTKSINKLSKAGRVSSQVIDAKQ